MKGFTRQLAIQLSEVSSDPPLNEDLAIGKLTNAQIKLSEEIFTVQWSRVSSVEGIDTWNYRDGKPEGLYEARELMGRIIAYPAEEMFVHGSSSLELMRNYILHRCGDHMNKLRLSGITPKLIIPVPGFYEHFDMCDGLGIEAVPMGLYDDEGPDADVIESLIEEDKGIMGIICVPRHSNPSGHIYSDSCIKMLSCFVGEWGQSVFHLLWDNVYAVHDHFPDVPPLVSLRDVAKDFGAEDYVATFASTSKITIPSSGLAAVGLSPKIHKSFCDYYNSFTVGPNRSLQLAHVDFFERNPLHEHMRNLTGLMRPNFDVLLNCFKKFFRDESEVKWSEPKGGFFISMQVPNGCAARTIEICNKAGVKLTPAGACFPNRNDPCDNHIRISPGFISDGEATRVAEVIALAVKLAIAQQPEWAWARS
jgi:DNA-binding transcriptional MocR family regulator